MFYIILGFSALITAIISGVIGMGGGILLLTLMTFVLPYQIIIPIHGIAQLVSNSSRTFFLRQNINKSFFFSFLAGIPIGTYLAYNILSLALNEKYYFLMLTILICYVLFKPKKLPTIKLTPLGWFILGIVASTLSPLLGATGPMLAIFYVRDDLPKEEIIATKAAQQILLHLVKIPLFISLGFQYFAHIPTIAVMTASAVLGTYLGVNILKRIDEQFFKIIFRSVLFLTALRLLYKFVTGLNI